MKYTTLPIVAAVLTSLALGGALAPVRVQAADAPAAQTQARAGWYGRLVNLEFVKAQAVVPKIDGVVLIDSRPAARKYDLGHIPTAVNIPELRPIRE